MGQLVAEILRDAGAVVQPPRGAFYLFPDFSSATERLAARGIATSDDLCERLLEETGIAILPGTHFGCAPHELVARLSYVNFDGGEALDAIGRLAPEDEPGREFLERYCPRTIEGVRRLAEWLRSAASG